MTGPLSFDEVTRDLDSLHSRLQQAGTIEVHSEVVDPWLDRVASIISECPRRSNGGSYEEVRRRVQYLVSEVAVALALGAEYEFREEIDVTDRETYAFDVTDPVTGRRLEVKRQKGYDQFYYPARSLATLDKELSRLDGLVDYIVAGHQVYDAPSHTYLFTYTTVMYSRTFKRFAYPWKNLHDGFTYMKVDTYGGGPVHRGLRENTPYLDICRKEKRVATGIAREGISEGPEGVRRDPAPQERGLPESQEHSQAG